LCRGYAGIRIRRYVATTRLTFAHSADMLGAISRYRSMACCVSDAVWDDDGRNLKLLPLQI
jgi:hypothetical protein